MADVLTLDGLIELLQEQRAALGGSVLVKVGDRGFELACGVEAISWQDLDDEDLVVRAVAIYGA